MLLGCGGALSEPAPDVRPGNEPTTPNPASLDSDPENCGRRGHTCDDATCTHGMCTPRVEATSAAFPETTVGDIAVLDGDVWAHLNKLSEESRSLVRFSGPHSRFRSSSGFNTRLVTTEPGGCSEWRHDCVVTDGKSVFLAAGADPATVRAFAHDGTPLKRLVVPDVLSPGALTADNGRLIVGSLDGSLTAVAADGTVIRRLPRPSEDATRPVLSGDDVYFGDGANLQHISLASTLSTLGAAPARIVGVTVEPSAVFALALPTKPAVVSVTRFSRNDPAGTSPLTSVLSEDTLEALTTTMLGVPFRSGKVSGARPVSADGRVYFSLVVGPTSSDPRGRIIVEWSEAEGFLPFAVIPVLPHLGGAESLELSYRRLYWVEQSGSTSSTSPWRIVSLPL